jgi:hypothetical protein
VSIGVVTVVGGVVGAAIFANLLSFSLSLTFQLFLPGLVSI